MKILITTSGLGSRIGEYTKYINKSLVPIQDKPAICHIIDLYPKNTSFVVTIGHLGDLVKQFLEICYPDRDITFVDVDKFAGEGSSLLYSISCARELLQSPFIFHACDTIVNEGFVLEDNWIGCGNAKLQQSCYRSVNVDDKYVTSINDKGDTNYDYDFVGVFGIKDYRLFWQTLDATIEISKDCPSDYNVLKTMLPSVKFKYKVFSDWLDIGNVKSLNSAQEEKPSSYDVLPKEKEAIYFINNKVIKFFHDKKICKDRINRATMLNGMAPNLIDIKDNFYSYKFVKGKLLSKIANKQNIKQLLSWSKENLWQSCNTDSFYDTCLDFYRNKTVNRINDFLSKTNIIDCEETINGYLVPSVFSMLDTVNLENICKNHSIPVNYHGDFVLDNILMVNNKKFTLIDWRQSFGSSLSCGDILYDIAKLNHSIYLNHNILMNNHFSVQCKKEIIVDIMISKRLLDCKKAIIDFCKANDIDMKVVETISCLIWLSMSPLHHYPLNKFLYYFGKLNLYRSITDE